MKPPKIITDVVGKELSLIFGEHKGERWSPINGEARVLTTKGGKVEVPGDASLLDKLVTTVKGWYTGGPVVNNSDNADADQADYNAICTLITSMYYDMSSATYISDDEARSAAVCIVIDNFLEQLGELKGGAAAKAGARHSAKDIASLNKIKDALGELGVLDNGANSDNAGDADVDVDETADETKAKAIVEAAKPSDNLDDNGLPRQFNVEIEGKAYRVKGDVLDKLIAVAKADKKKSEEPYGDVTYADPGYQDDKKKRYPLDTKAHAKAAWSFINQDKNASKYSAADLAKVKANIKAACKKFGIEIDDEKGAVVKPGDANAPVDVQSAVDAAVAIAKAALQTETASQIEQAVKAAKAESEGQLASLRSELDAAKASLATAETTIKAMAKDALKPGSPGFTPTRQENGQVVDPAQAGTVKAVAQQELDAIRKGEKKPSSIAEVVRLQRAAQS